ncbi:MAG: rhodanese-like domain-containing protein [Actinomycetota bacterium]|nr:rhodanese-like domain-containing protein [Actinomycetota bacterium]
MTKAITRDDLRAAIAARDVVVLEALPQTYFEKEHLPGARNLPLEDIEKLAPKLIPRMDSAVVTYCVNAACNNSAIAARRLEALGYVNVRKYPDGKQDWVEAGLPVEHGPADATT